MYECLNCTNGLSGTMKKYCSNRCQKEYEYKIYIRQWKLGLVSGNRGKQTFNLSGHIIRYLTEKYDGKCSQCGWHEINGSLGYPPLEIDHMDGDANNNDESNLSLLCPNCHSLTPNFRNLNKGYGRVWRRDKYVKIEQLPL